MAAFKKCFGRKPIPLYVYQSRKAHWTFVVCGHCVLMTPWISFLSSLKKSCCVHVFQRCRVIVSQCQLMSSLHEEPAWMQQHRLQDIELLRRFQDLLSICNTGRQKLTPSFAKTFIEMMLCVMLLSAKQIKNDLLWNKVHSKSWHRAECVSLAGQLIAEARMPNIMCCCTHQQGIPHGKVSMDWWASRLAVQLLSNISCCLTSLRCKAPWCRVKLS